MQRYWLGAGLGIPCAVLCCSLALPPTRSSATAQTTPPAETKAAKSSQPAPSAPADPPSPKVDDKPHVDDQALLEQAGKIVEHYNLHDPDKLAELFAEDAEYITALGDRVSGREAVREAFAAAFAEYPDGRLSADVESLRMLSDDVAQEEGSASFHPHGDAATSRSHYTLLRVRRDGRWQVASLRVVRDEDLTPYENLAPLAWLVGDWVDEGAEAVIEISCRWDDNQSFLVETFSVVQAGEVVAQGVQRIGWDPQRKQIRSWVFDADGGFGEGFWTLVDDRWIIQASGVQASGANGSMTRIIQPHGPNRILWTIRDRLTDSESLPDVSVTLVRKPPSPE